LSGFGTNSVVRTAIAWPSSLKTVRIGSWLILRS
jgi:hypothetical protein